MVRAQASGSRSTAMTAAPKRAASVAKAPLPEPMSHTRSPTRGPRRASWAARSSSVSPSPRPPPYSSAGSAQPRGPAAGSRPAIQLPPSDGGDGAADDDDDVRVAPGVVGDLVGGEDRDLFARGAEFLADDEGAVDSFEEQAEFGGAGAGRGEDGDLGVGAADVHRASQGAAVCDDHLCVVPGHTGAGEGGGHGGDGGDDFDLQAELGGAQGAYDAEEARVAVGEDDGGAPVGGDAAGGEGDAAEPDALGAPRAPRGARGDGRRRPRAWRHRERSAPRRSAASRPSRSP